MRIEAKLAESRNRTKKVRANTGYIGMTRSEGVLGLHSMAVFLAVLTLAMAGCDSGSFGDSVGATGSIAATAIWPGQPGYGLYAASSARLQPDAVPASVLSLTAIVSSGGSTVATGGPWNSTCSSNPCGLISGVPVGSGYSLTLNGWNAANGTGTNNFSGIVTGISVSSRAQTTPATVVMSSTPASWGNLITSVTEPVPQSGDLLGGLASAVTPPTNGPVSISGNYYVAGAPSKNLSATPNSGEIFVFTRIDTTAWSTSVAQITNPETGSPLGTGFGYSVGVSSGLAGEGFLIAGAFNGNGPVTGSCSTLGTGLANAGSAYIWVRDTTATNAWISPFKLCDATKATTNAQFGASVAISGNFAVVGAPNATGSSASTEGVVFPYNRSGSNTWTVSTTILDDPNGTTGDQFGYSVAITTGGGGGDFLIAGAPGTADGTSANGIAYVFMRGSGTTWGTKATLHCPGTAANCSNFGSAVAISGDYAIVGCPHCSSNGAATAGQAFIFHRTGSNTWAAGTAICCAQVGPFAAGANFASSVAISSTVVGTFALIGMPQVSSPTQPGSAFLFQLTNGTWTLVGSALPGPAAGVQFGFGVGIDGPNAIISAPATPTTGPTANAGELYFY